MKGKGDCYSKVEMAAWVMVWRGARTQECSESLWFDPQTEWMNFGVGWA